MSNSSTDLCRHVMVYYKCTPRSQSRHNRFPRSAALIENDDPLDAKSRHFSPLVFGMNIGPLGQVVDMYQFFWKTHVLKCAVHDAPSYKTRAQPRCDTEPTGKPIGILIWHYQDAQFAFHTRDLGSVYRIDMISMHQTYISCMNRLASAIAVLGAGHSDQASPNSCFTPPSWDVDRRRFLGRDDGLVDSAVCGGPRGIIAFARVSYRVVNINRQRHWLQYRLPRCIETIVRQTLRGRIGDVTSKHTTYTWYTLHSAGTVVN